MKKKLFLLGMAALLCVIGLVLAGCATSESGDGGGDTYDGPKIIKFTGYSGVVTADSMRIFSEQTGFPALPTTQSIIDALPPTGYAVPPETDGQTITYTVVNWEGRRDNPQPWTGTGKFFITINCHPPKNDLTKGGSKYVYSADGINATLVDINDEVTILEWAKFIWLLDYTAG